MVRNLLALAGLIALVLVSAATLQAQGYFDDDTGYAPPREAISIVGLDLTSPAGIAEVEARVNAAIDRVCPNDRARLSPRYRSVRACRDDAVAGVGPQIDRAIAAAEAQQRYGDRNPDGLRGYDTPPPVRWRDEGAPGQARDSHRPQPRPVLTPLADAPPPAPVVPVKIIKNGPPPPFPAPPSPPQPPKSAPPPPPPPPARPAAQPPAPPPAAAGRLVRRTVVTTTTTVTTAAGAPAKVVTTRIVKQVPKRDWRAKPVRTAAFARRAQVAGSWLPASAWAASDRATVRAFRTGRLVRWALTDRDGIARSGYVSPSPARWVGGRPCRNVQVVKLGGRKQLVVATGMRCLSGGRLINRAI